MTMRVVSTIRAEIGRLYRERRRNGTRLLRRSTGKSVPVPLTLKIFPYARERYRDALTMLLTRVHTFTGSRIHAYRANEPTNGTGTNLGVDQDLSAVPFLFPQVATVHDSKVGNERVERVALSQRFVASYRLDMQFATVGFTMNFADKTPQSQRDSIVISMAKGYRGLGPNAELMAVSHTDHEDVSRLIYNGTGATATYVAPQENRS